MFGVAISGCNIPDRRQQTQPLFEATIKQSKDNLKMREVKTLWRKEVVKFYKDGMREALGASDVMFELQRMRLRRTAGCGQKDQATET